MSVVGIKFLHDWGNLTSSQEILKWFSLRSIRPERQIRAVLSCDLLQSFFSFWPDGFKMFCIDFGFLFLLLLHKTHECHGRSDEKQCMIKFHRFELRMRKCEYKKYSVTGTLSCLHQRWNPSNQLISPRRSCWGWSNTPVWFRNSSLMRRTSGHNSTSCSSATSRWTTSSWCCRSQSLRYFTEMSKMTKICLFLHNFLRRSLDTLWR